MCEVASAIHIKQLAACDSPVWKLDSFANGR